MIHPYAVVLEKTEGVWTPEEIERLHAFSSGISLSLRIPRHIALGVYSRDCLDIFVRRFTKKAPDSDKLISDLIEGPFTAKIVDDLEWKEMS